MGLFFSQWLDISPANLLSKPSFSHLFEMFSLLYTKYASELTTSCSVDSVQFSRSVVSDSLWPHGLQHASLSITNSWSLLKLMSIELVMPSNNLILCRPFSSCLQSFPVSGSFPIGQFFTLGGHSIRASALASVLPMNIQDCFPLGSSLFNFWCFIERFDIC